MLLLQDGLENTAVRFRPEALVVHELRGEPDDVLPQSRGSRNSYILILSLICRALQQNRKLDFSLFVFRQNTIAIHCYQQLGFKFTAQPGPEHKGLYFMQLSFEDAIKLLKNNSWQFQLTSNAVYCKLQDGTHANLD